MHPARQEYYGLLLKVSVLRGDSDLVHRATLKTIDQLLLVEVDILICQTFGLHLFDGKIYVIQVEGVSVSEENMVGRFEILAQLVLK